MLLCDSCERGWHQQCLNPPLAEVPEGDWLCPTCVDAAPAARPGNAWQPAVHVGGLPLEWVAQFKYLGSQFHESGTLNAELRHRVALAAAAFRLLARPLFRQRSVRLRTRVQVYNCMVLSVLLYGSEAWALTAAQLETLEVFHRSRLRLLLGVRLSDRLSNTALYARCGSRQLRDMLVGRQLRWLGHLGRMHADRVAKQMLYSTATAGNTRRRGPQPPRIRDQYMAWAQERMPLAELSRAAQRSWYSACQDKAAWSAVCSAQ